MFIQVILLGGGVAAYIKHQNKENPNNINANVDPTRYIRGLIC